MCPVGKEQPLYVKTGCGFYKVFVLASSVSLYTWVAGGLVKMSDWYSL